MTIWRPKALRLLALLLAGLPAASVLTAWAAQGRRMKRAGGTGEPLHKVRFT